MSVKMLGAAWKDPTASMRNIGDAITVTNNFGSEFEGFWVVGTMHRW